MTHVRTILAAAVILLSIASSRGDEAATRPERVSRIDKALAAGAKFLVEQQQPDGTWRSQRYGLLKDGTSLSPLVIWSLPRTPATTSARSLGLRTMSSWVQTRSEPVRILVDPQSPVYTASLAINVLADPENIDTGAGTIELRAWRDLLLSGQLTEQNGWSPADDRFGGWGYSHEPPRKPAGSAVLSPLNEPNLSATVFALQALARLPQSDELARSARSSALRFVERCQNWRERAPAAEARLNDGGFHFLLGDDVRNKAGISGIDSTGQTRYLSYGSATADGLRGLRLCGLQPDHARVAAARRWLIEQFGDGAHPGAYPDNRSHLQPSLDYYYACSVAQALRDDGAANPDQRWAARLADRLVSLQRDDGSWSNPAVDVREDDPLIATSFALRALQSCRGELQQ